jgi:cell division protein FtsB
MLHSSSISPIADDGYAALLKILADPALHKQRLDELVAQEKATRDEINALNSMSAITKRRSSEAEAAMIVAKNRAARLDAREAEIEERTKTLESIEARRSDRALQLREDAVTSRENIARVEAERLAAVKADYDAKIAKFKKLHTETAL